MATFPVASSRFRLPLYAGLAAVAGALLAACTSSTHGTSSDAPTPAAATAALSQSSYVALGDSYTSGPGIPDQVGVPAGCARSSLNYPARVAQSLGLKSDGLRDVSCSGATIADLSAAQSTDNGTNGAQLDALSADTTLVTVGIGGNDVDFAGVLTQCVKTDLIPSLIGGAASIISPCQAYYTSGGVDLLQQKIQTVAGRLADALGQIKTKAPRAHVYVVGYPALLPSDGAGCARTLGITASDVAFLNSEEVKFNSMLRERAQAAGATYVDTYAPSVGHDACSDPADRWIEPLLPTSSAAPLHPNARGEQGMADAVTRAITAKA